MNSVQCQLDFDINTPSDSTIAKNFAKEFSARQKSLEGLTKQTAPIKRKKRLSKNAKKLARANKQAKRRVTSA
jgi:hypothetical protein